VTQALATTIDAIHLMIPPNLMEYRDMTLHLAR
jgi:hypothetical protein